MKVTNIKNSKGNTVPNQFIIIDGNKEIFQSYESVIAVKETASILGVPEMTKTTLDKHYWDYSKTTGKYRNQFLGETKAETQKKIDSGEYTLEDLN